MQGALLQQEKRAALQLELLEEDTQSLANCYTKVGWIYYELGDFEAALLEYHAALSIQMKLGLSVQLTSIHSTSINLIMEGQAVSAIQKAVGKKTAVNHIMEEQAVAEIQKKTREKVARQEKEMGNRDRLLYTNEERNPTLMANPLGDTAPFTHALAGALAAGDTAGVAAMSSTTSERHGGWSESWAREKVMTSEGGGGIVRKKKVKPKRKSQGKPKRKRQVKSTRSRQGVSVKKGRDESSRRVNTSANEDAFDQLDNEVGELMDDYKTHASNEPLKMRKKADTKTQPIDEIVENDSDDKDYDSDDDSHDEGDDSKGNGEQGSESLFPQYTEALQVGDWGISNTVTQSDDISGDTGNVSAPANRKRKAAHSYDDFCPPRQATTATVSKSPSSSSSKRSRSNDSDSDNDGSDELYYRYWSEKEDAILVEKKALGLDWYQIAKCLPGRSANACRKRHDSTMHQAKGATTWTESEDATLLEFKAGRGYSWGMIAKHLPNKSKQDCIQRYRYSLCMKHGWTEDQDNTMLISLAQGYSWRESVRMFPGRDEAQCRNRYRCVLQPRVMKEAKDENTKWQ